MGAWITARVIDTYPLDEVDEDDADPAEVLRVRTPVGRAFAKRTREVVDADAHTCIFAVDLVPADEVPETGWKEVLQGQDENGPIAPPTSTKTLPRSGGWPYSSSRSTMPTIRATAFWPWATGNGVDHGLTFHSEHKLRTVLGLDRGGVGPEELEGVDRVLEGLQGELGSHLPQLLTAEEMRLSDAPAWQPHAPYRIAWSKASRVHFYFCEIAAASN